MILNKKISTLKKKAREIFEEFPVVISGLLAYAGVFGLLFVVIQIVEALGWGPSGA